jgi:hypothetical protein
MKICPACNTQYTDDALRFCLQDGTPLVEAFDPEQPTVVVTPDTRNAARTNRIDVPISEQTRQTPRPAEVRAVQSPLPPRRGMSTLAKVLLTVLTTLLLAIAGIAAWYFLRERPAEVASNTAVRTNANTAVSTNAANVNSSPNAAPTPTASSTRSTPSPTPAAESNNNEVQQEVTQTIMNWKSNLESADLNAHLANYAPRVDYYNRDGANLAFVRSDKQRALSRYTSIKMDISNMQVTTDASGQTATAVFDKEWNFAGKGRSAGKVRSMLKLRNVNGQWLITAEKDQKVYYTQ